MKINWSLRFHNKVWLTTLLAVVCTFVFNLLDLFGIETTVAQEQVMQLGAALLSLLTEQVGDAALADRMPDDPGRQRQPDGD